LINFMCGRFAMASPIANDVWASTPKIFSTPLERKYSTRASATFVSAIVNLLFDDKFDYFSAREKAMTTFRRWADVLSCGAIFDFVSRPAESKLSLDGRIIVCSRLGSMLPCSERR
jgi:hypothetical protein